MFERFQCLREIKLVSFRDTVIIRKVYSSFSYFLENFEYDDILYDFTNDPGK